MIALKKETVQRIIDDIVGDYQGWKAGYGVCEGYRINVGNTIDDICVPNFRIDRIRIRINTVERIQQGHCTPLNHWVFCKINTKNLELRLYDGEMNQYNDRPDVKRTQLYEEMTANHKEGRMTLAEYMLMRAYDGETEGCPMGDLLRDFAQDTDLYDDFYAESKNLYNYISGDCCSGCQDALDETVEAYRAYCTANGLQYDDFKTYPEEIEEEEEDEDE